MRKKNSEYRLRRKENTLRDYGKWQCIDQCKYAEYGVENGNACKIESWDGNGDTRSSRGG